MEYSDHATKRDEENKEKENVSSSLLISREFFCGYWDGAIIENALLEKFAVAFFDNVKWSGSIRTLNLKL